MLGSIWEGIDSTDDGEDAYRWAQALWPLPRSLTGDGTRQTLKFIQNLLSDFKHGFEIIEVPSGTKVFDWKVPLEWNVRDAWIETPDGRKIARFAQHNLHLVGYSVSVDQTMDLETLKKHLFSLPDQPNAIPYVTSYYARGWGFCLKHNELTSLAPGNYRVFIDSDLKPGSLAYGELLLPGETEEEIFFSTYVCHPSMGNNELSGPCVTAALARWIARLPRRRYSYRFYFGPETIGAIAYIAQNFASLKRNVRAGYVVTCVGDDRGYSFLPSREGDTLADKITLKTLDDLGIAAKRYTFLDRGSDERQYCSPLVDLPFVSVMRSKYGEFPEYHTSLDDLTLISPRGLAGSLAVLKACVLALEANEKYVVCQPCEPQLGPRGLYPTRSTKDTKLVVQSMMNTLAYCDGKHDLVDLCRRTGLSLPETDRILRSLRAAGVVRALSS